MGLSPTQANHCVTLWDVFQADHNLAAYPVKIAEESAKVDRPGAVFVAPWMVADVEVRGARTVIADERDRIDIGIPRVESIEQHGQIRRADLVHHLQGEVR